MAHGEIAKDKKRTTVVMPITMWDEIVEATNGEISASCFIIRACRKELSQIKKQGEVI